MYKKEYPISLKMNGVKGEELSIPITLTKGDYFLNVEVQNVFNPTDPMQSSAKKQQKLVRYYFCQSI